jgi:hypothetical protein
MYTTEFKENICPETNNNTFRFISFTMKIILVLEALLCGKGYYFIINTHLRLDLYISKTNQSNLKQKD